MIKTIILENFMAHARSEISLTSGVTVLTGPNNTGKSAVVEALRCLSENPSLGRSFIRHGAKQATVTVELEDGTLLRWHRKKGTSWYEIQRPGAVEPEPFYKVGQGKAPPQVLELLRLQQVDIDDRNRVDVHLGDQRSPIFLIDRSGAQVAHFFAASSEGAHLLAMQDLLKGKVQEAKKEQQSLLLRQQAQAELLDRLAPLPDIALALETLEFEEREVTALAAALPRLANTLARLTALQSQREQLSARRDSLQRLDAPPEVEAVKHLAWILERRAQLLAWRARVAGRRDALDSLAPAQELAPTRPLSAHLAKRASLTRRETVMDHRQRALAPLAPPPDLEPVLPLRHVLQRKETLRRSAALLARRREAIAPAAAPPELWDVAGPWAMLQSWGARKRQERAVKSRADALQTMDAPPELAPVTRLQEVAMAISKRQQEREALQAKVARAETALAAKRQAIAQRLREIGHCPTCGQDLAGETVDTFLEGGHGHG